MSKNYNEYDNYGEFDESDEEEYYIDNEPQKLTEIEWVNELNEHLYECYVILRNYGEANSIPIMDKSDFANFCSYVYHNSDHYLRRFKTAKLEKVNK